MVLKVWGSKVQFTSLLLCSFALLCLVGLFDYVSMCSVFLFVCVFFFFCFRVLMLSRPPAKVKLSWIVRLLCGSSTTFIGTLWAFINFYNKKIVRWDLIIRLRTVTLFFMIIILSIRAYIIRACRILQQILHQTLWQIIWWLNCML